jgi:uncharacterized membrane protein
MWFIGLIIGLFVGVSIWGLNGAVIGAFVGWIAGLIAGSKIKPRSAAPSAAPPYSDRLSRLEQQLASIEKRLSAVERSTASGVQAAQEREAAAAATPLERIEARPSAMETLQAQTAAFAVPPGRPESAGKAAPVAKPQAPVRPASPARPAEPNFIVTWFTGGNTIVRIGIVILFFGVAFLVKYAADHAMFPIEFRLASAAAGAIVMLLVGWRVRGKNAGFGLTLQGGAVGILYLTIFAAFRIWHLLPAGAAFVLLFAIAVLSALLAIKQDAMVLAVFGSAGGFLAPILASTGSGSHVMLFSYYAVLNGGIFAVAWHKAWRPLNFVGFVFTFAIGIFWGSQFYRPELFFSTEPFLILFFLFYVAIAVLYALRQAPQLKHYVEGTLIFGTPLIGFGLQAALVHDFEYGLAFSSLVLAAFYLVLAKVLYTRQRDNLRLLVESFLAIGVVFATLTIPLALDARWTSAFWALEGAAVLWAGIRQNRLLARLFGLLLQLIAGVAFFHGFYLASAPHAILNSIFIGAILMAGAGLWSNRQLSRDPQAVSKFEMAVAPLLFLWGLGWWLFGGLREIDRFIVDDLRINAALAFLALTVLTFSWLHRNRNWREALWPVLAFLPVLVLAAFIAVADQGHPFANYGWIVWPLALAAHYTMLHWHDESGELFGWIHGGSMVLLAALGAWEMHWLADEYDLAHSAWSVASVILIPGLLLLGAASERCLARWPVMRFPQSYLAVGAIPIVIALWLWTFYANLTHDGTSLPLPYLPIVNAIDLGHIFVLLTVLRWAMRLGRDDAGVSLPIDRHLMFAAGGAALFVWLNGIVLRTIHHWAGIGYRLDTMWRSVLVQAALSIFWTVLALMLMFTATRKRLRVLWMVGAALMAVVVGKLFLVDLSHIGGIERIVSFIGVGVLMLVIGYFSPLPPAARAKEGSEP